LQYQTVLAHLRALQWVYTTTHWTSAGPNAYGDHLLLERLYTGLDKPIDALGERMVAYFGPQSVDPVAINSSVTQLMEAVGGSKTSRRGGNKGPLGLLYAMEYSLQENIKAAWKSNQDSGDEMSLGIDNYLADLADQRDGAIYLLRQRLRG
jgi:DNA-binding ferritin-like protein